MTQRLFTVRGQMCAFDEFVALNIDRQIEVVLHEPVLLERDIYLLMDALPTSHSSSFDGAVSSYVFEQLQAGPDETIAATGVELEFSFVFVQSGGGLRLSRITSPDLPPELLASAALLAASSTKIAQQACDVSINPLKRSVKIEIDQELLRQIPDRRTAVEWFGPPLDSASNSDGLAYAFRLKGGQDDRPIVRIDAGYDENGEHLKTVNAAFTRYNARVEVPEGTVRLTLN